MTMVRTRSLYAASGSPTTTRFIGPPAKVHRAGTGRMVADPYSGAARLRGRNSPSCPSLAPSRQDAYTTLVGEAIVAKVRLHVPVEYFRVADNSELMAIRAFMMTQSMASDHHVSKCGRKPFPEK